MAYIMGRSIDTGMKGRLTADNKICGECKCHVHEDIDDGWVCVNDESPYCTDWTDYTDSCDMWEQRGVK